MDKRIAELVRRVMAAGEKGISSSELARALGVSIRTMRDDVRRANDALATSNVRARVVPGAQGGYSLRVADHEALEQWLLSTAKATGVPTTPSDRVRYLLNDLLNRTDWITLEALAGILYVSRASISGDLRQVERVLGRFGLSIEKRPRYGIRVQGTEIARRVCLAHVALQEDAQIAGLAATDQTLDLVSECVDEAVRANDFQVSSVAYQNLIVHIAIALRRIGEGCYVPLEDAYLTRIRQTNEYRVASQIAQAISQRTGLELPDGEVSYIAIHLAGKQSLYGVVANDPAVAASAQANESSHVPDAPDAEPADASGSSLLISDEVWQQVGEMLEAVWQTFRFDFRKDLELRMNLARHLMPLSVRLRYHMELSNPILPEVRERFALAFSMAREASRVLVRTYGSELSDDEIGYLALAFALALERQKSELPKKRVLVVCATGAGSARLLEWRVRQEFAPWLDEVVTCSVAQAAHMDFTNIDYVFTTVPLPTAPPVPTHQIKLFFDEADARQMRDVLMHGAANVAGPFSPGLFFAHLPCRTKEEVLNTLIDRANAAHELPDDFRDLVWERERMARTAFGNLAAMPHPMKPVSRTSFAVVGLLDEPVDWGGEPVRAVFLVCIASGEKNLDAFYDAILDVVMSKTAMEELLRDMSFETLQNITKKGGITA